jgi:hypothetical protein
MADDDEPGRIPAADPLKRLRSKPVFAILDSWSTTMQSCTELLSPWAQTVLHLDQHAQAMFRTTIVTEIDRHARERESGGSSIIVRVIERTTSSTVVIEWRDPTHCSYGDQIWRASRARGVGTCAISGEPIHCGDWVYRPTGRPLPRNAGAMILASHIDKVDAVNDACANAE